MNKPGNTGLEPRDPASVTSADQIKQQTGVDSVPFRGSSEKESGDAWLDALRQAEAALPKTATAQQILEQAVKIFSSGYITKTLIPQLLAKEVGKSFSQALSDNLKNDPALRKQLGEHMGQLLLQGVLKQQQSEQSANDEYRKRFGAHQDDAINKAREAYAAPYQAMASLSSLGIFIGGIAKMLGSSSSDADWSGKAIAFGDNLIAGSTQMARHAGDELMKLEGLADRTRRAPTDWDPEVTVNVTPEFRRLAEQFQGLLSPERTRRLFDATNGQIDLRGSGSNGGLGSPRVAGGHYDPISVLSEATRDQVFAAMIMQESNGNPNAVSSAGARGLGQIMPGTAPSAAKLAGIAWDPKKYDADPQYQLRLSRAWFDHLADKYDGNMVLTLAAYNSGEGAVNDFMNGTNLSKNTRGGPTNPTGIRLGDPRKGETTDTAFAEKYQYTQTRIYIGKIASNVANGIGYDVAAAAPAKDAKRATQVAIDNARKSSAEQLAAMTKQDFSLVGGRGSAPRATDVRTVAARNDQGRSAGITEGTNGQGLKVEVFDPRTLPAPAPATIGG